MLDNLLNPFFIGGLLLLLLLIMVAVIYAKNYVKVPPNQVGVFTGRGEPKTVRGGARLRVPVLERVDFMELEPFNIQVSLGNAYSKDGVRISVEAVGLIRFGSADEAIQTAVQRFLTMDRVGLHQQLNEILAGNVRGIVAKMTVEELNGNREELTRSIIDEAGAAFSKIGMELDVLTIQNIADANGYLEALGRKRTAEVKRDAEIGEAEAQRDSKIKSAEARQLGDVAQAEADTAIAAANRDRDIKFAQIDAEVQAEKARAAQAGPLADAEAKKAVGIANEQAEAARVEARVEVERRRAEQEQQRLQADIIAPAEAARQAAIAEAEGGRQSAILAAEAKAEATRVAGVADADARMAAADAFREEQKAEADGQLAKLSAEAEGQAKLAESLNAFTSDAARLQLMPDILRAMVDTTREAAAPLGNIDRISIIGGSDGGKGGLLSGIQDIAPATIAKVMEVLESNGVDVVGMLNGKNGNGASASDAAKEPGAAVAPPASAESDGTPEV